MTENFLQYVDEHHHVKCFNHLHNVFKTHKDFPADSDRDADFRIVKQALACRKFAKKRAVRIIQLAWLKHKAEVQYKKESAAIVLQRAVIHWLYKPGGKLMQRAMTRFEEMQR